VEDACAPRGRHSISSGSPPHMMFILVFLILIALAGFALGCLIYGMREK
jgi:hypothetical protein